MHHCNYIALQHISLPANFMLLVRDFSCTCTALAPRAPALGITEAGANGSNWYDWGQLSSSTILKRNSLITFLRYHVHKNSHTWDHSYLCGPLTIKTESIHPWVQVGVCSKIGEIPSRGSWDIAFTRKGWTDEQPENIMPLAETIGGVDAQEAILFISVNNNLFLIWLFIIKVNL